MDKHSCFNSRICLKRFKTVVISREDDLLTLLSSFSDGEVVSILTAMFTLSILPT